MAQNWLRMAASALGQPQPADYLAHLNGNAARAGSLQASYLKKQRELWNALAAGKAPEPSARAEAGDRRFAAKEWRENPYYD